MSENELKDTQPNPVHAASTPAGRKKFPGWLVALVLVALIIVGILGGYTSGMGKRAVAQKTQLSGQLMEQYKLGVEAMNAGQYEVARLHFEVIIQRDSGFPGVKDAYANLILHMQITPTATPTPVPTFTPTADLRSADEIYKNLAALLAAPGKNLCGRDWNDILARLDSLRKANLSYHSIEVDGMYYIALRSRGVCKIYPQQYDPNATCTDLHINLEGGIYDLTLAEHFGPLDADASALRTWARLYITGASFWDNDWVQVKNYFSQLMASMPQLSDSTCTSATERWRQASLKYAQYLMDKGDFCAAEQQFLDAFSLSVPKNEAFYPTATYSVNVCNGDVNAPKTPTPIP